VDSPMDFFNSSDWVASTPSHGHEWSNLQICNASASNKWMGKGKP
jgi:hypothetical protein